MKEEINVKIPSMQNLLEAGVHFGHQTTRWNPKMKKFIYQKKDSIHIIDLAKTHQLLTKAAKFAYSLKKENKSILFVATKKQAVQIVKNYAEKTKMPYLINRWIGGLLTNYKVVSKNISRMNQLAADLKNNEFISRYTKREINEFKVEYSELKKLYNGVKDMNQLPSAIFVVDAHYENTAVLEARRMKLPVIAILDTNSNPDLVDYPIPGNDDSYKSIEILTKTIAESLGYTENNQDKKE